MSRNGWTNEVKRGINKKKDAWRKMKQRETDIQEYKNKQPKN